MKVLILFTQPGDPSCASEQDGLVQRDEVRDACHALGFETSELAFESDRDRMAALIRSCAPDVVFNLVESVDGCDRFITRAPALLEELGVPYTGVPLAGMAHSTHKTGAKRRLSRVGLPTAPWWDGTGMCGPDLIGRPVIIKSSWDHASAGIDASSVRSYRSVDELADALAESGMRMDEPFAELYVDGREFNVSMIEQGCGADVLPIAEIEFAGGSGLPRLVCHKAKWDSGSSEYHHTPRRFLSDGEEDELRDRLTSCAVSCWNRFDLAGYARVDFRVDAEGTPWILEVNANPCLSSDAGFVAAGARAGLDQVALVERILMSACSHHVHEAGA